MATTNPYSFHPHPLIDATFRCLPPQDEGLTEAALGVWLAALEANLRLVYRLDETKPSPALAALPPVMPRPAASTVTAGDVIGAGRFVAFERADGHPQLSAQPVDGDGDADPPLELDTAPPADPEPEALDPAPPVDVDTDPACRPGLPVHDGRRATDGRRIFTPEYRTAAVAYADAAVAAGGTLAAAAAALHVHVTTLRSWRQAEADRQADADRIPPAAPTSPIVTDETADDVGQRWTRQNELDGDELDAERYAALDGLESDAARYAAVLDEVRAAELAAADELTDTRTDDDLDAGAAFVFAYGGATGRGKSTTTPAAVRRPVSMPFEKRPFDPDAVRAHAGVGVDPTGAGVAPS